MRRGTTIVVAVVAILAAIAIGVGAYNFGVSEGLEESGRAGAFVRDEGPRFVHFPFGLILFPLLLFGIFALARAAFWGPRWDGPGGPPWAYEHWTKQRNEMFEDWHRRLHERGSGERPPPGAGSAQA